MTAPYIAPSADLKAFNCPRCGVYAGQLPGLMVFEVFRDDGARMMGRVVEGFSMCVCAHCKGFSLWHRQNMVVPSGGAAPLCHPDMPHEIIPDFEEARLIVAHSPRGAAALLILVIQKLCKHLGQSGENINADIAGLVELGLPKGVQRAFDSVRVIGNEAVHPGVIDLRDNPALAQTLFMLVNLIVEKTISDTSRLMQSTRVCPGTSSLGLHVATSRASLADHVDSHAR